jgi:uncharacterized membrane protein YoaK (UPF0700 family)
MDEQAFGSIAVPWPVPVVLSIVAGYVDSCTFSACSAFSLRS